MTFQFDQRGDRNSDSEHKRHCVSQLFSQSNSTMAVTSSYVKKKLNNQTFKTGDLREAYKSKQRKFCSPAWCKFLAVYDENDVLLSSHVVCKVCRDVFKSGIHDTNETSADGTTKKKGHGTSNLLRHSRECCSGKPKKKPAGRNNCVATYRDCLPINILYSMYLYIMISSRKPRIVRVPRCVVCCA